MGNDFENDLIKRLAMLYDWVFLMSFGHLFQALMASFIKVPIVTFDFAISFSILFVIARVTSTKMQLSGLYCDDIRPTGFVS